MFAYAAGCYFAQRLQCALEVIRPLRRQQNFRGFGRPFHLDCFRIEAQVREASALDRLFFSASPKAAALQKWLGPLLRAQRGDERAAYHFDPPLENFVRRHCYLNGYWQAAGYVEPVRERILREFQPRAPLTGKAARWAQRIEQLPCPVAVHIRLGDYELIHHATQNGRVSQVLPPDYYERALALVRSELPGAALVVFSDEPEKARQRLSAAGECLFVEAGNADYEDLHLMSLCHHQVIANSSFSWWAAWLNQRPGRKVFAPRHWGNTPESYFPDLFPPDWRVIENL